MLYIWNMNDDTKALELALTVGRLREAMRAAYEDGQLSLARIIFQEIVALNCAHYDAEARASKLPTTIDDNEIGRIVRERAAAKGH